eukprot:CAMPEP_0177290192 /NCGR_PEP_ID=MMETSP0367-20130122/75623_1 /TAXON_ID=447022 ORGANISM="Scrippsiella hangoei-like, Strain SHHI-4" /NCGR_SAMPLE_ID=MMETSP0367 /ASSEMBLY_ACC=CAM_ASM_000362 /LENGTH=34 /DNA_ID= /DNA_START= /DNA_END= /DNA_ORIENTATION=
MRGRRCSSGCSTRHRAEVSPAGGRRGSRYTAAAR